MSFEFNDLKSQYRLLKKDINLNINKVLNHGQYILGPEVSELEAKLSKKIKSKHCITVSSGTDALLIALMSLGIKRGDEIITSAFTYISTIEVIALLGAKPILVDINSYDFNINPYLIEKKISKKTKAILPVSLFGMPVDMGIINNIAKKNGNIPVIEDGAQSFGAIYKQRYSCNLSLIGCTSFFPSKPLGCYGDGGAVFTNNSTLAKKIRMLRQHGQGKIKFHHDMVGLCARMDTIQSAVLLSKLKTFDQETLNRIKVAEIYNNFFDSVGIPYLRDKKNIKCIYSQYPIIVEDRKKLIKLFKKNDIPFAIYYPKMIHDQLPYKNLIKNKLDQSKVATNKIINLPISGYLKYRDQKKIMDVIIKFLK